MQTYAQHIPTAFDSHIRIEGREDWLVAPVSQTRDSGPLDRSNFRVVLADLGGESETVEVHRFGHWGPGWYEIVLVHPSREKDVRDWVAALAAYPVASDEDYSELEYEQACRAWECMCVKERVAALKRYARGVSVFAARRDEIPDCPNGSSELISYLAE